MIRHLKSFLYRFLPEASKKVLLAELHQKDIRIQELKEALIETRAYARGLERGLRSHRGPQIYQTTPHDHGGAK